VLVDDESTMVTATDLTALQDVLATEVVDGAIPTANTTTGDGDAPIVVEEQTATDEQLEVGSSVEITFADGATIEATVAAVITDSELLHGMIIPTEVWVEHEPQPALTSVLVTLADRADIDTVRTEIEPIADTYTGDVQNRAEFAASRSQGIDLLLDVVYVMLALAILIALLGIANTLSLSVHERRHEIGLLRAVGQTRRQTRRVLRIESVLMSSFGTIVGCIVGGLCGSVMFRAVFDNGTITWPGATLATIVVLGTLAGTLAAWRPARRASRLAVLDAISAPT
jgi:putative ABC transport system permease protein